MNNQRTTNDGLILQVSCKQDVADIEGAKKTIYVVHAMKIVTSNVGENNSCGLATYAWDFTEKGAFDKACAIIEAQQ